MHLRTLYEGNDFSTIIKIYYDINRDKCCDVNKILTLKKTKSTMKSCIMNEYNMKISEAIE